jgi:phosphocarrier protein HPr
VPHCDDLQPARASRAAARFVKTAGLFNAEIWVRKNGTEVSGRSIMGLMMLAAAPGAVIRLAATGPDAEAAVTALAKLVECKFDED